MTESEAKRHSERIAAQKEKEKKGQAEKEMLQKEIEMAAKQGLPEDGSLMFKKFTWYSGPFNIDRQEVWQREEDVKVGVWATKAHWKPKKFYPGQILRITHTYPHSNLEAKYSADLGEIAMTDIEPVGLKMRWAVVLWTSSFGIFVLP
ncbi:unnamed protein product [Aureobasidium vineae]|uniref:Uncharacterized protein n=1 Tax=Aureobasidium vineae TaxID=2773715 RepID=A0A9N8P6J1_9PEZI|nr:unnamed protein product [Aureobasidium vineae]